MLQRPTDRTLSIPRCSDRADWTDWSMSHPLIPLHGVKSYGYLWPKYRQRMTLTVRSWRGERKGFREPRYATCFLGRAGVEGKGTEPREGMKGICSFLFSDWPHVSKNAFPNRCSTMFYRRRLVVAEGGTEVVLGVLGPLTSLPLRTKSVFFPGLGVCPLPSGAAIEVSRVHLACTQSNISFQPYISRNSFSPFSLDHLSWWSGGCFV